jgi:ribosomal protein S18 acetylase RimI-like enzyme
MKLEISPLQPADIDAVAALARVVWESAYAQIITPAQVDYMLAQRYDAALLRAELRRGDLWWDKATADGTLVAFAASFLVSTPAETREMKLDKLYVDPARQRLGVGGRLIAQVCERARTQGCASLILAVNKRNEQAIAAYRKYGFVIAEAVCVDIGGGFVMDDFIMRKSLRHHAKEAAPK